MKKFRCIRVCYFNHRLWSIGETATFEDNPNEKNFELVEDLTAEKKPITNKRGKPDGPIENNNL